MSDSDPIIFSAPPDHTQNISFGVNASTDYSELGIVVAKDAEHLQSLEPGSCFLELDKTHRRRIYIAVTSGNWSEASSYFKIHPHWWRISLSARGITALHVAVTVGNSSFVEKLGDCMNIQDLEICMEDGNTAFCLAAITGNVEIAEIMFDKNPRLLWIKGQKDMLPIQLASSAGHIPMTEFLLQKTQEDFHNNLPFQDIVKLFFLTISNSIYSVTSKLLDRYPNLATIANEGGLTPLQMLAQISLCKETIGHQDIVSSLFKAMDEEKESLDYVQLSKAMFDAAKSGNIMILEFLFEFQPDLLFEVDSEQRNILHIAILYRQKTVYQLILSKGDSKNVMIQLVDIEGNNVLHFAGKLAEPEERFELSTNYVLMCSEELWFQEVEEIVPPAMKTMRNKHGSTPKELFHLSHKQLHKESISDVKGLANTLIVVATLIITIGISLAITIPIDNIDSTHTPIFRRKTWYTIFFLSVAVATCCCASSMLFYASAILSSSMEPKDESVRLRLRKMILGSMSLFASAAFLLIAVISGATLIFEFLSNWGTYFTFGLGCMVFVVHFTLDHILWSGIIEHSVAVVSFWKVALVKRARSINLNYISPPIGKQKKRKLVGIN